MNSNSVKCHVLNKGIGQAMDRLNALAGQLEMIADHSDMLAGNFAAEWPEVFAKAQASVNLPEVFAALAASRDIAMNEIAEREAAMQAKVDEMRANGTLATEKQVAYLRNLGRAHEIRPDMSKKEAGALIDRITTQRDAYWQKRKHEWAQAKLDRMKGRPI